MFVPRVDPHNNNGVEALDLLGVEALDLLRLAGTFRNCNHASSQRISHLLQQPGETLFCLLLTLPLTIAVVQCPGLLDCKPISLF